MLTSPVDSKQVFWFYNELFKTILGSRLNYKKAGENEPHGFSKIVSLLIEGREADFDVDDPLPFLIKIIFSFYANYWIILEKEHLDLTLVPVFIEWTID